MKNKEKKKDLIESGKFKDYCKKRKEAVKTNTLESALNCYEIDENTGEIDQNTYFYASSSDLKELEQIRRNRDRQRKKIQNHIEFWIKKPNYDIFFVTFTFSDETLLNTGKETRKKKVNRLCSKCEDYITNIDYGTQTEREHYHGVIALKKGTYNKHDEIGRYSKIDILDEYSYGYYSAEEINKSTKDAEKIAKYITKLVMHSVKVQQQYISTKKGTPYQKWQKLQDKLSQFSHEGILSKQDIIARLRAEMDEILYEKDSVLGKLKDLFGEDKVTINA